MLILQRDRSSILLQFGGLPPVTGHPQTTQTTAANISWDVLCRRTHAAAQVTMYMAKLLGSRLLEAVNMPQENVSSTSSLLLVDTPA